jgi:glycosyltransferase involved in cell wall biosynthesis
MTVSSKGVSAGRAHVVHVITMLEWGGAQENTLFTVERLDPLRFESSLAAGPGGMLDPRAAALGEARFRTVPDLCREVRPRRDIRAFLQLRSLLRETRFLAGGSPLIVHTHSSKAGILGRAAARAERADAIVHSVHGFGFHDGQPPAVRAFYVRLERVAARWTDAFVVVSEENARLGSREGIFPPGKCRLIRSGFDTGRFLEGCRSAGRGLIGVREGVPVVGTVAVMKPQKAPLDFVAVARRVAARFPEARFVMVGDGDMRPEVERAVSDAGLSDRFHLLGWRPDVPDLISAFDVFLLTSRWEGLPKVVPQALIAGVPVVATAVDGTKEIVDEGLDGFLARPGDVVAMAEGVGRLLSGKPLPGAPGKKERLLFEFDQAEMVRAQERLYAELLAGKGCPGWR